MCSSDLFPSHDTQSNYVLLRRGKRRDYFTSCLPWPQKGPAVSLPLGTTAPVVRTSNAAAWKLYDAGTNTLESDGGLTLKYDSTSQIENNSANRYLSFDPMGGLYTNLSSATAATINDLRLAFQTQKFYEKQARGGTRYTEVIKSHFGVVSPDARLQRPEYLGGGSTPINFTPVAQTSVTSTTPRVS